jgi:peptidyl-dipeptidase A
MSIKSTRKFIDQFLATYQPLSIEIARAQWNLSCTGDAQHEVTMGRLITALREFLSDPSAYQEAKRLAVTGDTELDRQVQQIRRAYLPNQVPKPLLSAMTALEVRLEGLFSTFRSDLNGTPTSENSIKEILRSSQSRSERQVAWEASKQIGALAEPITLELVGLRNEAARLVGFSNYYSMRLAVDELDEARLFSILQNLAAATDPLWRAWKGDFDRKRAAQFNLSLPDLRPWDYDDPFFQERPRGTVDLDLLYRGKDIAAISRRFFASIGLPVDAILERSDLYERPGKNQHAFCNSIDRRSDVRILCNLKETEKWMDTQLHELGHATYDFYLGSELPFLLREPAHTSTTEAIAMLFGRLSKERDFLTTHVGVPEQEVQSIAETCLEESARGLLVFARWVLVMTNFERAMYATPTANLRSLWWDLVEQYQGVNRPDRRDAPDWASKVHLSCAPAYYQNYILGEMNASQLRRAIARAHGDRPLALDERSGTFLKERLFASGATFPWEETLQRATGAGLTPQYFVDDLAVGTRNLG